MVSRRAGLSATAGHSCQNLRRIRYDLSANGAIGEVMLFSMS